MPVYPKAGVSLDVDSSDWDSTYKSVLKEAGNLDSLAPTVKVSVNDSEVGTAYASLLDLERTVSPKVTVDDRDVDDAKDKLDDIATIGAIDLAINIAGTAKGFFEGLGRFSGVGGILELDSALAMVEARTGKMIPDAEKLINTLYTNGWGESRTQIAGVVAQAAQLGLEGDELEAAVLATLQVVSVTGGDATETLNKLDGAAKANGLTFTETADLFIAGYQTGNDKADDLLDTLSEYGTTFSNFRLSAEGAMAFLNSGLDKGVFNTDVLADSVREIGIRLGAIGTDPTVTAAFEQIDSLSDVDLAGLLEGYEAGLVTGDEMLQGIIDALADVDKVDHGQATVLGEQLVGTQLADMGVTVFGQLSTDADTAFGDIEGRAETAGNAISATLAVTVDTFLRGVEQMAVDFLSSDAIDLDGKIEVLKTQLATALSTITSGGSLGEALEIGFGITGVDAALANIGRVFGQFTITLLEIVAAIQDPLGINDADAGTRGQIATMATAQLPFDLSVANPDEFEAILKQAAERGVSLADMGTALGTALETAIAAGDFERANAILAEQMLNAPDPATVQPLVDKYTALIDEAIAAQEPPAQDEGWWNRLKPPDDAALAGTKGMQGVGGGTGAKGTNWWDTINVSPETIASLDAADEAVVTLDKDVDTAMTNASLVTGLASQEMIDALSAMSDGVVTADEEIAMAVNGNTMTASFDTMSESAVANADITKAAFMGILATVANVDQRLTTFFSGVMTKVAIANDAILNIGVVPPGGGGNSTTNNVVVNNTNNVQSGAQATALGYELGAQVRGFG